ncbi:MAG: hydrogen peroxide-inducible genes activator, partial [Neisseriaceae bacterium]|nr:hydrogen peroxide-inducible genes activator [Neisseriaceae bacterium]
VSQEKHFGKAAQKCFVSQPTLSISIKKLEDELDVKIFDRSSSEIITTPIGAKIIEQAKKVIEESNKIKMIVSEKQDELSGEFKLGLIFTIAPYILPKMITNLIQLAPKMPLMLEENYTSHLLEMLKNGELDAIIAADPIDETGIETIPLYEEPFFVIVPKGHPFEEYDQISTKQLTSEKILLLTEGNCLRDNILDRCKELAAQQRIQGLTNSLQGNSITTVRYMVASGLAISILPSTALYENDHTIFSIIPFENPAPKRTVILCYRKNFFMTKAIDAIKETVFASNLAGVSFIK